MRWSFPLTLLVALLFLAEPAQSQGYGRRGGVRPGPEPFGPRAPKLPGVELEGPLDSATARQLLQLNDEQARRYAQVYDSFMVATRPQRDSAGVARQNMNERLDQGDRAAAMFYAERLQALGKYLKDRQDKFEDNLGRWLSADQVKSYRRWKEGVERAAQARRREEALRWEEAAFGGAPPMAAPEQKTSLGTPGGVAAPDLGAAAVRVGRTVYVATQLGVDSTGTLTGTELRTQAERAFANLTAVLRAAGAAPRDVVALTIYVVNYKPTDVTTIRGAGASYFGSNPPITTALGVQSLGPDGALISIGATAVTSAPPFGRAAY